MSADEHQPTDDRESPHANQPRRTLETAHVEHDDHSDELAIFDPDSEDSAWLVATGCESFADLEGMR